MAYAGGMQHETVAVVENPPLVLGVNPQESERVAQLLTGILNW